MRLWRHVEKNRQWQLVGVAALTLASTLSELLSVGTLLPFLTVLSDPQRAFESNWLAPIITFLGLTDPAQLALPLTIAFCLAIMMSGVIRAALLWTQTRTSFAIGNDLATEAYQRTLHQPYLVHISRNSSEVVSGIMNKVGGLVYFALLPTLQLASAAFALLGMLVLMISIDPVISSAVAAACCAIYLAISWAVGEQLKRDGELVTKYQDEVLRSLQEGLGGIREVILDGHQDVFVRSFRETDLRLRNSSANIAIISSIPRFAVETLGTLIIAVVTYAITLSSGGLASALPILGALALAAQRSIPLAQQAYQNLAMLRGSQPVIRDALALLDQTAPALFNTGDAPIAFKHRIELTNISFAYHKKNRIALDNIDLTIEKGSRIGIVGATGSGKSTVVDLLMGLLPPTIGILRVDGQPIGDTNRRGWQKHIAHVPQSIFLIDATIAENIAFGVPRAAIDMNRALRAAHQAQLAPVIADLDQGLLTMVGERGLNFSGGQRQRIGIARALYKQADVLILDEATSALDEDTESAVIDALSYSDYAITTIIVTHRLASLERCDKIIEVIGGQTKLIGSYKQLIELRQGGHRFLV